MTMASSTTPPRRALRTSAAAQYLGVSPSLLRKKRLQGPGDPQAAGPAYIQLSPSLIVIRSRISTLGSTPIRVVNRA